MLDDDIGVKGLGEAAIESGPIGVAGTNGEVGLKVAMGMPVVDLRLGKGDAVAAGVQMLIDAAVIGGGAIPEPRRQGGAKDIQR